MRRTQVRGEANPHPEHVLVRGIRALSETRFRKVSSFVRSARYAYLRTRNCVSAGVRRFSTTRGGSLITIELPAGRPAEYNAVKNNG